MSKTAEPLQTPRQANKISTKTRIHFGLAALGMAVVGGIYANMLTIFYQDYLGLGAAWIGTAAVIYAVWNAINDPIFGQITDNTRSKHGRRIPFMRFTAPFYALTFIAIWFAPENGTQTSLFIWMLVSMLLYDTCYTIIGLVHGALVPELSESDTERGKLQVVGGLFGLLGTLIGFIIPDLVRPKAGSADISLMGLRLAMIAVGIICAFLIMLASYNIKEHREFSVVDEPLPLGKALKATLVNKSFVIFVIANFMCTFMFSICMGAIFYTADYVTQTGVIPLLAALFIPLAVGMPLTKFVLARVESVVAFQFYMFLCGLGLILVYFLPANLIPIGMAVVGLGYAGVQVVTYLVLGNVIDEDEVRTGVRREGSYLGANALITKPAQSLAISVTAFILAATSFVTRESNAGDIFLNQPESAVMGIRAIVGLIPGISLIIGALVLFFFPLRGQKLAAIKTTILEMHSDKKERLDAMEQSEVGLADLTG